MCFTDYDSPKFMTETQPVARKPHQCIECWDPIPAGAKYHRVSGKWDDVRTFTICLRCEGVRDTIYSHELDEGCRCDEASCPFGGIAEYLGEFDLTIAQVAAGAPIRYAEGP